MKKLERKKSTERKRKRKKKEEQPKKGKKNLTKTNNKREEFLEISLKTIRYFIILLICKIGIDLYTCQTKIHDFLTQQKRSTNT